MEGREEGGEEVQKGDGEGRRGSAEQGREADWEASGMAMRTERVFILELGSDHSV